MTLLVAFLQEYLLQWSGNNSWRSLQEFHKSCQFVSAFFLFDICRCWKNYSFRFICYISRSRSRAHDHDNALKHITCASSWLKTILERHMHVLVCDHDQVRSHARNRDNACNHDHTHAREIHIVTITCTHWSPVRCNSIELICDKKF